MSGVWWEGGWDCWVLRAILLFVHVHARWPSQTHLEQQVVGQALAALVAHLVAGLELGRGPGAARDAVLAREGAALVCCGGGEEVAISRWIWTRSIIIINGFI